MTLKERLQEIISELNITQNAFEDSIGAARGTITRVGDSISSRLLDKITATYPRVNSDWIISGRGEKYFDTTPVVQKNENKEEKMSTRTRELLNEIEKQRLIIMRFQSQIDRANEQINKCQEHINILLNTIHKEV